MKLECYLIGEARYDIRPADHRRQWMDETPSAYAYRCLPLSIANSHGWEICCAHDFEAEWTGGNQAQDIVVTSSEPGDIGVKGHFGSGILSFESHFIIRTEPGYNLWVSGPPNRFKDAIQALSAVIETDWIPFSFSMNWKFTRPHTKVRFSKGEPYCFFFPVRRDEIEAFEPQFKHIDAVPELKAQYLQGTYKRTFRDGILKLQEQSHLTGTVEDKALRSIQFQGWYSKGELPDGSATIPDHRRKVRVRAFRDGES